MVVSYGPLECIQRARLIGVIVPAVICGTPSVGPTNCWLGSFAPRGPLQFSRTATDYTEDTGTFEPPTQEVVLLCSCTTHHVVDLLLCRSVLQHNATSSATFGFQLTCKLNAQVSGCSLVHSVSERIICGCWISSALRVKQAARFPSNKLLRGSVISCLSEALRDVLCV